MGYKSPDIVAISGGHTLWDPADSTTYYFGLMMGSTPSTGKIHNIVMPIKGNITKVAFYTLIGTVGTTEASVVTLRKNDTTDYTIKSFDYSTTPQTDVITNLHIPVSAGDIIIFKEVSPAWVTNPLQIRKIFCLILETD